MSKKTNATNIPVHGRFHFKSILPRFSDTAIALLNGDIGDALRAFSGAVGGQNDEPEAQAYTLLWQSMKSSVRQIFEHRFREGSEQEALRIKVFEYTKQFCIDLWKYLPEMDLVIDKNFIHNPMQHVTTLALRDFLKSWMRQEFNISESHAQVAVASFPRYFLQEMAHLSKADFTQLFTFFEKPFQKAEEKALAFEAYQAGLMSEFDRPAFGEQQVSLVEMYVPPHFRFFKPGREHKNDKEIFRKPKKKIQLKEFLNSWLNGTCPEDTPRPNAHVLLLLGQPGQGKSSFCYSTAYDLLSENRLPNNGHVFMIRLRDLAKGLDFIQQPLQVALDHLQKLMFRSVELQISDLRNGLLILDGLDEFYMNNGLTNRDTDDLLYNLVNDLRRESEANPTNPFHCLLTSRTNYVRLEKQKTSNLLILEISEMLLIEQQEWLKRYENTLQWLNPEEQARKIAFLKTLRASLRKLNASENENEQKLLALVNQPILLQIVAQAETDPLKTDNRAELYQQLFDNLVHRKWAKDGQIKSLETLTEERATRLFRQFLQALALHIFYSKEEYARRSGFAEEPLKEAVNRLKAAFPQQENESFLKNLMVSFYFKEVRKDEQDNHLLDEHSDYAYEFLHKSLQEYLVAEYYWTYFRKTLILVNEYGDYTESDKTAMEKICDMFSPRLLTKEVVEYIHGLVRNDPDHNLLEQKVFKRSKNLMSSLAQHSYLWHYDGKQTEETKPSPLQRAVATFYGILTINSALVTNFTESNSWPIAQETDYEEKRKAFGERFHFLSRNMIDFLAIVKRMDTEVIIHLPGANLSSTFLTGIDFSGAFFAGVNFSGSILYGAIFSNANLVKANLAGADLDGTLFFETDLREANLTGIRLRGAYLYETNLAGANLAGASLAGASLALSELTAVDLRETYLTGVDLTEANLTGANLTGANLTGANLTGANLTEANLTGANLTGANLTGANLENTYFNDENQSTLIQNLDKICNLDKALNKNKADWHGTIYEGHVWDEPEEET